LLRQYYSDRDAGAPIRQAGSGRVTRMSWKVVTLRARWPGDVYEVKNHEVVE
jgi:hypothetical protein